MVFGLWEGQIEIVLGRNNFKRGEKIEGKVVLHLNKPKKAKEFSLMFYGEKRKRTMVSPKIGSPHQAIRNVKIYEQKRVLDGEKEYAAGASTYDFSITIPNINEDDLKASFPFDPSKTIMIGDVKPQAPKWYLESSLSAPLSFDIKKKLEIVIE